MATETLTFSCPHCTVRLTVPASLAGISGPCPSCSTRIIAPQLAAPAPPPPIPKLEVPPPEDQVTELPEVARLKIRPEPRHLPERPPATPISTRHSTDDQSLQPQPWGQGMRPSASSRITRAILPAIFSALAVSIVYLLLYFYLPNGPRQTLLAAERPLVVPPPRQYTPAPEPPEELEVQNQQPVPRPPLPEPPLPQPKSHGELPGVIAANVLNSFLTATDAASRVGLVEPAATEEQLASTFLKGPLPEVAQTFSELPRYNAVEQVTDFPFRVSFFIEGQRNVDFAILVRQRGEQPPKVYLPAFLDLVGGRLSKFTKQPNNSPPEVFHVILEAVAGCHEEGIPDSDRKFTFKLLPSPYGRETARAYVSIGSRFKKLVDNPESALRWGLRIRASVTLQWNYSEDPEQPYLELLDINSLDWNP